MALCPPHVTFKNSIVIDRTYLISGVANEMGVAYDVWPNKSELMAQAAIPVMGRIPIIGLGVPTRTLCGEERSERLVVVAGRCECIHLL